MSPESNPELKTETSENLAENSTRYNPTDVETRIYKMWESAGYFKAAEKSKKPPYSIIMPPPNVTGRLHMGHALDHSIQDLLIRWKRMSGFNALWLPGTDHAGIATQMVVERELKKEKLTRHELGREKFVEKVWAWKHQYGNDIYEQMRRLGDSCDWERATFTLDEGVSQAVRKVFVDLHKRGLIYRGKRLVNWSWPLETAISDLEVEHRETKGTLYHLAYEVEGAKSEDGQPLRLVLATTRPETLLGDTAVAVHPEDDRYKKLIGKRVKLPLTDRMIQIIGDTYVDKAFGTGVVKITPAHDFNDYQIGVRHKLEMINILNKNGTMNENAGRFQGLKVQEARKQVILALKEGEFLVKEEPYQNSVGYCERSGAVVEPMLSEQWFVRMSQMATAARHVVENGSITFEPESWTKVYLHWMSIIEDWCISRQIWWGHRVPVWNCENGHATVAEKDPSECSTCHSKVLQQDTDVLDTWFSSALWPFSTMGWPGENGAGEQGHQPTELEKTFYPTDVLVTGHDIIFFWVARMIIMGMEFKKDVPFRKVFIHGLIRDASGQKMSKSTGNALDPVELIEKYGADALRFTILAQISGGRDLKFSESRLEGYRNFMNKIWNATRFSLAALEDFKVPIEGTKAVPPKADLSVADQWIVWETQNVMRLVDEHLSHDRFSDAANALYQFVWNEFCDWYLEFAKPVVYSDTSLPGERKATQLVLAQTLNRIMRLLHPFTPFITEEIYAKLPIKNEVCMIDTYPTVKNDKEWLSIGSSEAAFEMGVVKEVITAIRNIRGENQIKPGVLLNIRLAPTDDRVQKILQANKPAISRIARIDKCDIGEAGNLAKCAVAPVRFQGAAVDVIIPLEGVVDLGEEVKRIQKTVEKIRKDISILSGKLSNEAFMKNAPEDLVAADRALLAEHKARLSRLQDSLTRLA